VSAFFVVEVAVEVFAIDDDYDPAGHARVAARFAASLPAGSQVLENHTAMGTVDGVGRARVRIPATAGPAGALHAVALAFELAVMPEPLGLARLGRMTVSATEDSPISVTTRGDIGGSP